MHAQEHANSIRTARMANTLRAVRPRRLGWQESLLEFETLRAVRPRRLGMANSPRGADGVGNEAPQSAMNGASDETSCKEEKRGKEQSLLGNGCDRACPGSEPLKDRSQ